MYLKSSSHFQVLSHIAFSLFPLFCIVFPFISLFQDTSLSWLSFSARAQASMQLLYPIKVASVHSRRNRAWSTQSRIHLSHLRPRRQTKSNGAFMYIYTCLYTLLNMYDICISMLFFVRALNFKLVFTSRFASPGLLPVLRTGASAHGCIGGSS